MTIQMCVARFAILLVFAAGACFSSEPLTLQAALKSALRTAAADEARVLLSYGRLHYLESQNKSRFELRPQLGLLAFSNPLLLASNLGAGFLWQRMQAPGAFALRNAEFDVLASEVACARRRLDAQVDTARVFFELLELQHAEQAARDLLQARWGEAGRVDQLLEVSRITVQDKVAFDVALVELEIEISDLEVRRKSTALDMARLIGSELEVDQLQVTADGLDVASDYDSMGRDALTELAIERRQELKVLRNRLAAIPGNSPANRRVRFDSAGASYANIGDSVGSKLGMNPQGFLLGGNTGRTDLGLSISLRNTGENAAAAEVAAARRRVIELELQQAEDSVRAEVEKVWMLATASRRKLELSARKLELTRAAVAATKARVDHGLGPITAVLSSELELLRQQSGYEEALSQQRTRVFHLMAATGLDISPRGQQPR